ncbi:glycosyltransferase family 4 protein [Halopiger djelfimassiliensis]|uniref:glycosyltransferase family 4 protein n=1 Tax=Halopiger djelfimassiliensis TaxID=1293047 RepID=UPI0006777D16|nr:glycosyltransferase family 4 protein [Halopiger djelfimassiliensis]
MDGLHLTTAHDPVDTRIFDKEALSLERSGFDVGIMAHEPPGRSRNGVRFYDLGAADTRLDRWRSIRRVVRNATAIDAALYHFHDPELIPVGIYLSETTDSAVIYDVHEDYGHVATTREWIPEPVVPLLSHGIPKVERLAATRFDAIVAVSEWIAEPFVGVSETVSVVHNYPRTNSLPSPTGSIERTADHVLCYVGGLVEVRGLHRMLELLDALVSRDVDVELWAVGSWKSDADRARAGRFVRERNLESRVRFPGYLGYEEMFQYLRSADVGLALLDTAHYRHGVPTKLFEYLYAGLPVVTTPVDAVSRFVPDRYCHVVPQGDTAAAADAVETALHTDYDATAMRSLVEAEYSWEAEAESLVALYEDLID